VAQIPRPGPGVHLASRSVERSRGEVAGTSHRPLESPSAARNHQESPGKSGLLLARFTASELFPVGLPVTFETPLLLGTRLDLQTLNEVPPAQNGRFSHLLTTENRKHRVICTIDAGVSRIGLFTPKFQTAFKPVVFESVVRQRKAPNLVCFSAAKIRRTSCTLGVPEMSAFSSFGVFGVMPSATTYVVSTDSTGTIPTRASILFRLFSPTYRTCCWLARIIYPSSWEPPEASEFV